MSKLRSDTEDQWERLRDSKTVGEVKKDYTKYGYKYMLKDSCGGRLYVEVYEKVPLYSETNLAKRWAKVMDFVYGIVYPDIFRYSDERSDFKKLKITYYPPSGSDMKVSKFIRFGSNRRSVTRAHSFTRREYIPSRGLLLSGGVKVEGRPMQRYYLRRLEERRIETHRSGSNGIYHVRHLLWHLPESVQGMIAPYYIDRPNS